VHAYTGGVPRIINLVCDRSLMQGAQMRVNKMTPAIIEESAGSLGLRLMTTGHPRRRKSDRIAPAMSRSRIAMIAALVFAAVVVGLFLYAPVERLIDAPVPAVPAKPAYQPPISLRSEADSKTGSSPAGSGSDPAETRCVASGSGCYRRRGLPCRFSSSSARLVLLLRKTNKFVLQFQVALQAIGRHTAFGDGRLDGAAWLVPVPAIGKVAA